MILLDHSGASSHGHSCPCKGEAGLSLTEVCEDVAHLVLKTEEGAMRQQI